MTTLCPDLALVGVAAGGAGRRLLAALGMAIVTEGTLGSSAAQRLFGLEAAAAWWLLAVPGSTSGRVLAVETPHPPEPRTGLCAGPVAVDVFTTQLDRAVAVAEAAGARAAGHARYLREDGKHFAMTRLVTDDGVPLVVIEASAPRPSQLDRYPELLVSEVTATLSMVADVDAAAAVWTAGTGLKVVLEYTRSEKQVGDMLELPRPQTPHHMVLLAPPSEPTFRFELVGLPGERVSVAKDRRRPLCQGLVVTGFKAVDPPEAAHALDADAAVAETALGLVSTGIAADGSRFLIHNMD